MVVLVAMGKTARQEAVFGPPEVKSQTLTVESFAEVIKYLVKRKSSETRTEMSRRAKKKSNGGLMEGERAYL